MNKMKNLKINLHVTEKCNYKCRHCFSHFNKKIDLTLGQWCNIINNIKASKIIDAINFAGGEPVLYKGFDELLKYAKNSGFKVSMISNGSLLLDENLFQAENFKFLSTLGISVDSTNENVLLMLGRCNKNREVLYEDRLCELVNVARKVNPSIKIKLNTVVSKINLNECITRIEQKIRVDKWKFLKIKPFNDNGFSNLDLLITDNEFSNFLGNNKRTEGQAIYEKSMVNSYIVIDNQGNLLDNRNENYDIVGNLLEESFSEIFRRYKFDRELYESRYN